jgi:hypothetical protein
MDFERSERPASKTIAFKTMACDEAETCLSTAKCVKNFSTSSRPNLDGCCFSLKIMKYLVQYSYY